VISQKSIICTAGAPFIFACLIAVQPVEAKEWTVERYSQCLQHEGQDALDIVESINTNSCRKGRLPIVDSDFPVGYFDIAANVAASREKRDDNQWSVFATFRIETTSSNFYGGASFLDQDDAGFDRFVAASSLVNGSRMDLTISSQKRGAPKCQSFFRSRLGMTKCQFASAVVINLTSDVLAKIRQDADSEPSGSMAIKIFNESLKGVTLDIPYAEILAVEKAVK
jgi:hypothetical protein